MYDIISVGDIVIDFLQCGYGPNGNPAYEMNPGGAPANQLVVSAAFGARTAFIGKTGNDMFGNYVSDALVKYGISVEGLVKTDVDHTMITFVSTDADGDRSFYFVGKGLDRLIEVEDLKLSMFEGIKIINCTFGISSHEYGRRTLAFLQEYAIKNNILFSADPNYRPGSEKHKDLEKTKKNFAAYVSRASIIKASEEEMELLTGETDDYHKGAKMIADMGIPKRVVVVTLGSKGAYYYVNEEEYGYVPGFPVKAVDTTGCGDAFLGTINYFIACEPDVPMKEAVKIANATGALCATRGGAFDSMPSREEVMAFIDANS